MSAARPWVRQCARRLLQWGQSLTARPARGARRAPTRPNHPPTRCAHADAKKIHDANSR